MSAVRSQKQKIKREESEARRQSQKLEDKSWKLNGYRAAEDDDRVSCSQVRD
jgi:hypothetical protein